MLKFGQPEYRGRLASPLRDPSAAAAVHNHASSMRPRTSNPVVLYRPSTVALAEPATDIFVTFQPASPGLIFVS